jgi:hyperosmotically inducible periplasmic protein
MRLTTFLLILGLVTLVGCSTSSDKTAAAGMTDSDLERSIKTQIATDPQVPAGDISVSADADKNTATLSGTVTTEAARTRIVNLAKLSRPGLSVTDKIDVKPTEVSRADYTEDMAAEARRKADSLGDKIGKSLDDAWIHTKITTKLSTDSETPAHKINVDVMNKVVTLRGEVKTSTAKMEAGRIAKETDGVKAVNNLLRVKAG